MVQSKVLSRGGGRYELEVLLHVLLSGELLAHSISKRQSQILQGSNTKVSNFLRVQSRQELMHARLFQSALLWLNPKSIFSHKQHVILEKMEEKMQRSLGAPRSEGNILNESMIGLQIIVESLGESALEELETLLAHYSFGLANIGTLVLNQERSHHAFGEHYIALQCLNESEKDKLRCGSAYYFEQAELLFDELSPALDLLDFDRNVFVSRAKEALLSCLG